MRMFLKLLYKCIHASQVLQQALEKELYYNATPEGTNPWIRYVWNPVTENQISLPLTLLAIHIRDKTAPCSLQERTNTGKCFQFREGRWARKDRKFLAFESPRAYMLSCNP